MGEDGACRADGSLQLDGDILRRRKRTCGRYSPMSHRGIRNPAFSIASSFLTPSHLPAPLPIPPPFPPSYPVLPFSSAWSLFNYANQHIGVLFASLIIVPLILVPAMGGSPVRKLHERLLGSEFPHHAAEAWTVRLIHARFFLAVFTLSFTSFSFSYHTKYGSPHTPHHDPITGW